MRWALPLVLLSLLAGCTSTPPEETVGTTTTTTAPTPPSPPSPPPSPSPPPTTPPTQPTPPTPPPPPPPRPAPESFEKRGNTTGAVAGAGPDGAIALPFTIKPNATRITALLWWNASAPADYDLRLYDPKACATKEPADRLQCVAAASGADPGAHADEDGTPAGPDAPAKVEIDLAGKPALSCAAAEGCRWTAEAAAKAAAQGSYHLLVVVEY